MASESLRDKEIIQDSEITDRIDYLEFLEDDDLSDADRDLWADEIVELAALRKLREVSDEFGGLISEDAWNEYAVTDAEDKYDLKKSGADMYFDFDQYADDLQTDFSSVEFLGTTYYYQG